MPTSPEGSRQKLLDAAAQLLATDPEQSVSVRAVCTLAGVQLPTLYHFFENKQGLVDAVVEAGFQRFATALTKATTARRAPSAADALRAVWDAHVSLGRSEPALYVLMYGRVQPGSRARGYDAAFEPLLARCTDASAQRLLTTSASDAARRLEASAIGTTLALIATADDPRTLSPLSADGRDAVISSLTADGGAATSDRTPIATNANALIAALADGTSVLEPEETALLRKWLQALATPAD